MNRFHLRLEGAPTMPERRRTKKSGESGDLGVAIRTLQGVLHAGRIEMVSNEQVTISFPVYDLPDVEEGSRVTLLFRTIRGGELTAAGRMIGEAGLRNGCRRFHFVFDSIAGREQEHPPVENEGDSTQENRRAAFRVKPDRRAVPITLRPYGDPNDSVLRQLMALRVEGTARTAHGWVFDISADGIGILLEDTGGYPFEVGDHLDLSFTIPGDSDPVMLGATVKHRMTVRIGVRYGLAFDRGGSAHFQRIQQRVLEFVMRQQQRELRRKMT